MTMNYSHLAIPLVSLTLFCSPAYCEPTEEVEKTSEQLVQESEHLDEDRHYVRYGRKMQHNRSHDEYYCGAQPCSNYRRLTKMSHEDRKMLRQQVNDASRSLDAHP